MKEILTHLPNGARVLDLGCAAGSYDAAAIAAFTVRADLEPPAASAGACSVVADAARLPFRSRVFDAVICNHSVEHFAELNASLAEIGRVLKACGAVFISVPDASTFTDRVYRWLARGGGHVNRFESAAALARRVEQLAVVDPVATATLCTSFSFLNRRNTSPPRPKKIALFLWGLEKPLICLNALLRIVDRRWRTRTSVYGWALYFGRVAEPVGRWAATNVCVRCGQGHPSEWLIRRQAVRRRFWPWYECPVCGARNYFSRDEQFQHLRTEGPDT
jgi:SAM-dependent methyltransferase